MKPSYKNDAIYRMSYENEHKKINKEMITIYFEFISTLHSRKEKKNCESTNQSTFRSIGSGKRPVSVRHQR